MRAVTTFTAIMASTLFASTQAATFTKTIGYSYSTHHNAQPTCGGTVYHKSDVHCPSGCKLSPLNYAGAKSAAYGCKPTAAATQVAAWPIVAHMSCHTGKHDFTKTVTPQFGAHWTTCASKTAGKTVNVPAATVALVTKKP